MKDLRGLRVLPILLILFLASNFYGQETSKASLLVAVCASKEKKCEPQTIKKITFENGKQIASEDLLTFDANTTRFERVGYRLLQNRYIVSQLSDIFDIQTKELFSEQRGEYLGNEKDLIYIFQNKGGSDVKLFSFNLTSRKYNKPEFPSIPFMFGYCSPSILRSIQYYTDNNSLKVTDRKRDRERDFEKYLDGVYKVSCGKNCKDDRNSLPMLWLDDDRLLTQKNNGELYLLDFKKNGIKKLMKIPVKEELESIPVLYKDFGGNIHYRADKDYLIDVENRKYTEAQFIDLANGFKGSISTGEETFMFGEKEIGKFLALNRRSTKNYLAVEFNKEKKSFNFPDGIKVWNNSNQQWLDLDVNYSPKIVGWIEE